MNDSEKLLRNYISSSFYIVEKKEIEIKEIQKFLLEIAEFKKDFSNLSSVNESKAFKEIVKFSKRKFSSIKDLLKNTKAFLWKNRDYIYYVSVAFQIYTWYVTSNPSDSFIVSLTVNSLLALFNATLQIIQKLKKDSKEDEQTEKDLQIIDDKIKNETDFSGIEDFKSKLGKLDIVGEKFV